MSCEGGGSGVGGGCSGSGGNSGGGDGGECGGSGGGIVTSVTFWNFKKNKLYG